MAKATNSPWLMWGQSQSIVVVGNVGSVVSSVGQQGAMVSYGRPENWQWLFVAKIIGGHQVLPNALLAVAFDLTLGLGRGNVKIDNFTVFNFNLGAPSLSGEVTLRQKWSTEAFPPQFDDAVAVAPPPCNAITAETIAVSTRVTYANGNPADRINLELSTFFSPSTHVRADWFGGQALGSQDR